MSHLTEGNRGIRHIDRIIVTVETRKLTGKQTRTYAWRQNGATQGIHLHANNRRLLTAQAYQCQLKARTGIGAWTNM